MRFIWELDPKADAMHSLRTIQDFIYEDKKSEAEAGGNGTAYEEGCPEITREKQLLAGE